MRRILLISALLLISLHCFAQQRMPDKIIGRIPDVNSTKTFKLQVGAFKITANAENVLAKLRINALNPATEKYLDFTRVVVKGIPASQVANFLAIIKQAGFNEVIIREDTPAALSEKWEINSPDSAYSSFEFNNDNNYIAVENNESRTARFGDYSMPQKDIIEMDKLGTIRIKNNNDKGVNFSFYSIEEPEKEVPFTAAKAETIAESPQLDLLCRTWKTVFCTDTESIGTIFLFTNAGTYFYTRPDGYSNSLSRWRWYDEEMTMFEYSHDDWQHYGRVTINELTKDSMKFLDPGYSSLITGYSNAHMDYFHELVPLNK